MTVCPVLAGIGWHWPVVAGIGRFHPRSEDAVLLVILVRDYSLFQKFPDVIY